MTEADLERENETLRALVSQLAHALACAVDWLDSHNGEAQRMSRHLRDVVRNTLTDSR